MEIGDAIFSNRIERSGLGDGEGRGCVHNRADPHETQSSRSGFEERKPIRCAVVAMVPALHGYRRVPAFSPPGFLIDEIDPTKSVPFPEPSAF